MAGRGFHGDYRFGYQGSEKDNEVSGDGNSYTTEFRQLDPRLGRWFSVDPVFQPWQSPYTSMDNNPIGLNDPSGLKVKADPRPRPKDGQITIGGVGYTTEKVNRLLSKKESDINPVFGKLHKIFHGHKDKFKQIKPKEFTIYTDEKTGEQYTWDYDDDGAVVFYKLIPKAPAEQKEEQTHAEAEKIEIPIPDGKKEDKKEDKKDDKKIQEKPHWDGKELKRGATVDNHLRVFPFTSQPEPSHPNKPGDLWAESAPGIPSNVNTEISRFANEVRNVKGAKIIKVNLTLVIAPGTSAPQQGFIRNTTLQLAAESIVNQLQQAVGTKMTVKIGEIQTPVSPDKTLSKFTYKIE